MEKKFNSISEEVKTLVNEFMATVKGECDRKDIVKYVKEHVQDRSVVTDGIIAGSIKMLTATGELVVVSRARYKKGIKIDNLCLKEKVIVLFEAFQRDLQKACTVNLLGVSNEDMEFIQKVSALSNQLECDIWKLEEGDEVPEKEGQVKVEPKAADPLKKAEVKKPEVKKDTK
ncbi:hypothetical protein LK537_16365 [Lachnoclostridium pacaense]|uniref:hypothetical protein n=1 Tax=Enterocloster hominis (ex Hitch et al. 2024) TaxID=1917870 RepID=UPI001D129626|nr:hypothetical protein [Lachnoclostridium pacaense]MCC2818875.1 hypothetical protein [Lachnoclostridium pacaense]